MKILSKLKVIFGALLLIAFMCSFLSFGCGGNDSGDTDVFPDKSTLKPQTNTSLCYLEDFGQGEILKPTVFTSSEVDNKNYLTKLEKEKIEKSVYFSSVTIPDGKCKVFFKGKELGAYEIVKGKIVIESVPDDLKIGNTYDLEILTTNALYKQKFKYVSKAIYDKEDLVLALTYYKSSSGDKNESKAPNSSERTKFYDGETFTKRLYVLANDVSFTVSDVLFGLGGSDPYPVPTRWLIDQGNNYFYDDFDGQGYCVRYENLYAGGMFGRIGGGARIKNLCVESVTTYWTGCGNTHDSKSLLATSVAGNCVLENLALRLEDIRKAHKLNLIAPYISETVKLKDIYIYNEMGLYDENTVTSNNCQLIDSNCGYLGYDLRTRDINNVVVVSKFNYASRVKDNDKFIILCAENQSDADFIGNCEVENLQGCSFYSYVSEMGNNTVGDWQIVDGGKAIFLK